MKERKTVKGIKKSSLKLLGLLLGVSVIAGGLRIIPGRCRAAQNAYTITQQGPADEKVRMFYTITNKDGELAVIDGGWETDAPYVREVIASLGNRVSAWVITHPHPDHVGALNAILANYGQEELCIERVYTIDVHEEAYRRTAKGYDEIEAYDKFLVHLQNLGDAVTYLSEGDHFSLVGLTGEVLSAWDEEVDLLPVDLCNDGSLVFRLSGEKESMVFFADLLEEREERLLSAHPEELLADYLQLGHHGNWGLTTKFYDHTDPIGVFFDAPPAVLEEGANYDGYLLKAYWEGRGVATYEMGDAPNAITLR